MVFSKERSRSPQLSTTELTPSQKRRFRRKKLQAIKEPTVIDPNSKVTLCNEVSRIGYTKNKNKTPDCYNLALPYLAAASKPQILRSEEFPIRKVTSYLDQTSTSVLKTMNEKPAKKDKSDSGKSNVQTALSKDQTGKNITPQKVKPVEAIPESKSPKCRDEVDKACIKALETKPIQSNTEILKSKEQIIAERAAKKAAKQAKKKGTGDVAEVAPNPDMTVKDVVETLKDIKNVAKDIQDITAKPTEETIKDKIETENKEEESSKSKADLKAERRAKQEAQRAAKQAAAEQKAAKVKTEAVKPKAETAGKVDSNVVKEKSPKPKPTDKAKAKPASANRVNWFQHLYAEHDEEALNKIAINSNIHPAIIKVGVQSASLVVNGSNARCIALLDALKKMVRDYTLPAKTEFSRGLEAHLTANLQLLWSLRQPCAAQDNAVKYFRRQLTQLPNNINEFDAKKILLVEIDRYIDDQIDKAGEAISMAVQKKISTGDNILTYGYSSLIERILREAWEAKLKFRTVVVGDRIQDGARNMLRRLVAAGLPCTYVDITAVSFIMKTVSKVLLGAGALLGNGSVLGAAGSAQVALVARDHNVPVLVACETHKFSPRVQTDAFVYNELGDPDALIDKNDENSPLKDWRSNPNLTLLNLTYDVTPASLVTAVVTEKAILPCTSAPVVLRTKLTEYGM